MHTKVGIPPAISLDFIHVSAQRGHYQRVQHTQAQVPKEYKYDIVKNVIYISFNYANDNEKQYVMASYCTTLSLYKGLV